MICPKQLGGFHSDMLHACIEYVPTSARTKSPSDFYIPAPWFAYGLLDITWYYPPVNQHRPLQLVDPPWFAYGIWIIVDQQNKKSGLKSIAASRCSWWYFSIANSAAPRLRYGHPLWYCFFFWIQVAFKTETTGFGNPNENQQATYCWWFFNSQCLHNNTSSNLMAYYIYIYIYKWRNNMEHHIPSPPASPTFHQLQWRSLSAVVPQRPKWMGMPDTSPTKSWLVNDGWWWLMMVDDG